MIFLIFYYLETSLARDLACESVLCSLSSLGDSYCDKNCNTIYCDFDSIDTWDRKPIDIFYNSDCIWECVMTECDYKALGNGECDPDCDKIECGFDLGDCGYCGSGCFESDLGNGKCDPNCNTSLCMYDANDCGWCAEGCFLADLSANECIPECNVTDCLVYDSNPCIQPCMPGCFPSMMGNGICDEKCNYESCNYDLLDCICSEGCTDQMLLSTVCLTNNSFKDPCDNPQCNYKNGACGICAQGCLQNMLGNGVCDLACYNEPCFYDYQDCGCAPGCNSYYNSTSNTWSWDNLAEHFQSCLVPFCLYNYGSIDFENNVFTLREFVLNQIINQNWALTSISLPSGCSLENLEVYDSGIYCDHLSPCMNVKALYCMGMSVALSNCIRNDGTNCLVCEGLMVMNTCAQTLEECPEGYVSINSINLALSPSDLTQFCIVEPTVYNQNHYKTFYVEPYAYPANCSGNGTLQSPFLSIFYCFTQVYASFTKIILKTGTFHYVLNNNLPSSLPLISDLTNPLNTNTFVPLYELWLIGESSTNWSVVYWHDTMKISPIFSKFYVKNVIFSGLYILSQTCNLTLLSNFSEYCYYCPLLSSGDGYTIDQSYNFFTREQSASIPQNCQFYHSQILFNFQKFASFENVNFTDFRHQFNYLIQSTSSLNLTNVSFNKLQPFAGGMVIDMSCENNCLSQNFNFENGFVTNLNYGYKMASALQLGGFFMATSVHNIMFNNVTFYNNIAVSSVESGYQGFIVKITSQTGVVVFSNSVFNLLYVDSLISVDVSNLIYSSIEVDYKGFEISYSQTHFQFVNNTIFNVYASTDLISYYMKKIIHNIYIVNLTIYNVYSGTNGIIYLINSGTLQNYDTKGQSFYLTVNGTKKNVMIPARTVLIENLNIFQCSPGISVLSIQKMPLITLNQVTVSRINDHEFGALDMIGLFFSNSYYFDTIPSPNEISDVTCNNVIMIQKVYSVTINDMTLFDLNCVNTIDGNSGLFISQVTSNVELNQIVIYNITSNSSIGVAIYINGVNGELLMNSISASFITNHDSSAIEIGFPSNLTILNSVFTGTVSYFEGPFQIIQPGYVNLINISMTNGYTLYGSGGCLSISIFKIGTIAYFSNLFFENCLAPYGVGGGLIFQSESLIYEFKIKANSLNFENCYSIDGSAIYISNQIHFKEESFFSNIIMKNNTSLEATVSDNHIIGNLTFTDLVFINNFGTYSAIAGQYITPFTRLKLINLYITSGFSGKAVCFFASNYNDSTVYLENVTIHDVSSNISTYSDAFQINDLTLEALDLKIYNTGNVLVASESAFVSITDSIFFNLLGNFANIAGSSNFICKNCEVFNATNSLISLSSSSILNLKNSRFYNNIISASNSALVSISKGSLMNTIENCTFVNNTALIDGLFLFQNCNVSISNSKFHNNNAIVSQYSGFMVFSSEIAIYKCDFQNQTSVNQAAFIYIVQQSLVYINSSSFFNGFSVQGGAISIQDSTLKVESSNFIQNNATEFGGTIYSKSSTLQIKFTNFTASYSAIGAVIFMQEGRLYLNNSKVLHSSSIYNSSATSIYVIGPASLYIYSSIFLKSLQTVSAISAYNIDLIEIEDSRFENLNCINQGAVSVTYGTSKNLVAITNSYFLNNTTTGLGGAMFFIDVRVSLKDVVIENNYANMSGGGIYFNCLSQVFELSISGNSQFIGNRALIEGGAVKWESVKPVIDSSVFFSNNSAEYGNDIASVPASLAFSHSRLLANAYFSELAPGQTVSTYLLIYLKDTYGQVVTTDSSSTLSLQSSSAYPKLALSGQLSFTANKGLYNITGFIPDGPQNTYQEFKAITSAVSSAPENDFSVYNNSITVAISLRNCTYGEQISPISCSPCSAEKFLIDPDYECLPCPTGATCLGSYQVLPQPGYWRSSNFSEVVYGCIYSKACLGNTSLVDYTGTCAEAYHGAKCGACLGGYTITSQGVCNTCPSKTQNVLILITIFAGILALCALLVKSSINSAFEQRSMTSIYIKIFTNYVQLMFLTSQFNLKWPSFVYSLFGINQSIATSSDALFSIDCYVATKNSGDPVNSYYYKLVLFGLLPFFVFLLSFLYWLGIAFIKISWKYLKTELFLTMIVVFFLFYPNIVKFMFSNFACENIDLIGEYLIANYAIKCWDFQHTKFSFIVAIPSIIIWAFGLPTLVLIIMIKRRRFLNRSYNRVIFGFLFNGYRSHRFFWEFIIMYRKIIMISVSVFALQTTILIQGLSIVLILIFSVSIQYKYRPFSTKQLNFMELESLMTATLTLYCGLFFLTDSISYGFSLFLFLLIVAGNAYFYILWIYWMGIAILDSCLKIFPVLKYTLNKGDAFDQDFYSEEIYKPGSFFDNDEGNRGYTFLERIDNKIKAFRVKNIWRLFKMNLRYENGRNELDECDEESELERGIAVTPIAFRNILGDFKENQGTGVNETYILDEPCVSEAWIEPDKKNDIENVKIFGKKNRKMPSQSGYLPEKINYNKIHSFTDRKTDNLISFRERNTENSKEKLISSIINPENTISEETENNFDQISKEKHFFLTDLTKNTQKNNLLLEDIIESYLDSPSSQILKNE